MKYVDGYLLPLPKKNLRAYRKMAQWGERAWRKAGALDYRECVADDFKTPCGIPFPKQMKLKRGETLVFAYVVFKSRAHRDKVNARVIKEMMATPMPSSKKPPFDMNRMVYAGFTTIVGS
jgi:uncharacterized protein YbaA (DUF1428 family)